MQFQTITKTSKTPFAFSYDKERLVGKVMSLENNFSFSRRDESLPIQT
jgi:hypothetical protein